MRLELDDALGEQFEYMMPRHKSRADLHRRGVQEAKILSRNMEIVKGWGLQRTGKVLAQGIFAPKVRCSRGEQYWLKKQLWCWDLEVCIEEGCEDVLLRFNRSSKARSQLADA